MALFRKLYDKTLVWSRHRHAPRYLAGMSFAESSFFPIPVDVMLAPMVMADRDKAFRFAFIATVFSVLGGLMGYVIGYFAIDWLEPWLQDLGYWDRYTQARDVFTEYGVVAIFIAGFSPIPYKVFTIAAGAMLMNPLAFAGASLVGRAARFYLVAGLVYWGGPQFEKHLLRFIDWIGWATVALAVIAWWWLR